MDEAADLGRQGFPVDCEVVLRQQLAGPRADEVDTEDRAVLLRHDLDHAVGVADDHRPAISGEHVLVHFDLFARRPGLGLGKTAPGGLGMRVDRPRHLVVVDRDRALAQDGVDGHDGLRVGDVGEPGRLHAVADRVDVLARRGHRERVDLDEAAARDPDASGFRPDVLGDRPAADRDQHLVDLDLLGTVLGLERDEHSAVGPLERAYPGAAVYRGTPAAERLGQDIGDITVRSDGEDRIWQRLQQRRLGPQIRVDRRELRSYDASADHGDAFGQGGILAVGGVVRAEDTITVNLHAREGTWHRPGANDHGPRARRLTVDLPPTARLHPPVPLHNPALPLP